MKKKIAAALLAFMLVGSVSEAAYAAASLTSNAVTAAEESVTEEVTEELMTETDAETAEDEYHVEMSYDNILQKGGLLAERETSFENPQDGYSANASVTSAEYKKVEKVILEAIDAMEPTCNLAPYSIDSDDFKIYAAEIFNSNPRYFYLYGFSWNASWTTNYVTTVYLSYDEEYTKSEVKSMLKQYDAAVNAVLQGISASWTDMEKLLYLNDYFARNCAYDTIVYTNPAAASDLIYTAYGVLVNKSAVCQGYALAYYELAEQLGIPCQMITSNSINHAWNMVKVNDKYYQVDVTWDDPTYDTAGWAWHEYFMKSTKYLKADPEHFDKDDWVVSGGWNDTYAKDTAYDSCVWDDVISGFDYIGGYWYGFDLSTGSIAEYSCNGTTFKKVKDVKKIDDVWYAWGTSGAYSAKFVGNGGFNGKFYYSTTDTIYELNLSTGAQTAVYTLTDAQKKEGYIYGMVIEPSGQMKFTLAQAPASANGTVCLATTLTGTSSSTTDNLAGITYQISFDGNGSTSGSMSAMKNCVYGTDYTLTANAFKKKGYTFKGWNTKKDGSGVSYKDKATVKNLANKTGEKVTLYAQWKQNKYTIKFNGNGSTSGKVASMTSLKYGTSYKLNKNKFKRKGYTFAGWNTKKNGSGKSYDNQAKVKKLSSKDNGTVTLYAQWKKNKYTIKYYLNGGKNNKKNPSKYYVTTSTITLKKPTRKGYTFVGWYTDKNFKHKITKIKKGSTGNLKLYAKWKKK